MMANAVEPVPPTPVLPYDAEVEWLKGDGSAFIDTGVNGGSNVRVECDVYVPASVGGVIFGEMQQLSSSVSTTRCMVQVQDRSNGTFQFFQNTSTTAAGITKTTGRWVSMVGDWSTGKYTVGSTTKSLSVVSYQDSTSIYLFARHKNMYNSADTYDNPTNGVGLKAVKIRVGGVLVRDYKCVRKNGVGYLYDTINGTLNGNANSTGAFTYGNDVNT